MTDATSSDTFCLKWNEFEKNVSETLKDFKDDPDFFDVTLACEDEQVQAHKIIISACSPFFRKVLKRHRHNVPLLYLKGVRYKDLVALLTFMYHGEVNVAQNDINQFLATAEELQVKGLSHKDKRQRSEEAGTKNVLQMKDNVRVKSEPSNASENHVDLMPNHTNLEYNQKTDIAQDIAIEDGSYDPDLVDFNTESFTEGQNWKMDETAPSNWTDLRQEEKQYPCPICNKVFRTRGSLSSHKYSYHKEYSPSSHQPSMVPSLPSIIPTNPLQLLDFQMDTRLEKDRDIECPICHKFFSSRGSLATHKYNYHRNNANPTSSHLPHH